MAENIYWQKTVVSKTERQKSNKHKACIVWFTGLSGSGKSTLARDLEEKLFSQGCKTYILDGDNIRHGLNKDLEFSDKDRIENIRRISEVAKLFVDAGLIVIVSFISPFKNERAFARNLVEKSEFIEVFVKCPVSICEQRDVKGLYAKARKGEIKNFTGIDSNYEEPEKAEIIIETDKKDVNESVLQILNILKTKKVI